MVKVVSLGCTQSEMKLLEQIVCESSFIHALGTQAHIEESRPGRGERTRSNIHLRNRVICPCDSAD